MGEKFKQEALMERTSAACAMEWSIDLEKGLRSKKPGRSLEAILRTMQRLELWDREPAIKKPQYDMFKLLPGEDRLFANSILLRLADAFSSGDKQIKLFVAKVFLSIRRNCKRGRRQHDGIMFKCSLENRSELLKRVKVVFDNGDVESRALALVLFGCWADFAKDNADIRYLVLSSLVSCDVLQVEASLFAGGCFCELSGDFASVLLEILVNLLTSSMASATIRVAGARIFAKMGYSSSQACKAYKAGLKLVLDFSEEEFSKAMLISLSKLALRSSRLIPEQVSLLFSFFTQEKPLGLQAVALKCLHYTALRGICHFPVHAVSIQTLVRMLDESEYPPALQCGALQMLHKVLLYNLTTNACADMLEFSKLLRILQNATQSPIMEKRHLAILLLVDLLGKLLGRNEKALDGVDFIDLACGAVSFISDEISLLAKLVPDPYEFNLGTEQNIKNLLGLLFVLVKRCPDLGAMVVDRVCLLMENVVNKNEKTMGMVEGNLTGREIMEFRGQDGKSVASKLLIYASKIVNSFLENLNLTDGISTQVLHRVELMVKQVDQCSLFDFFTQVVCSFLLHSRITYCRVLNEIEKNNNPHGILSITLKDCLAQHDSYNLVCAKKILATNDNWSAYKLGRYAACQGVWSTAAFMFEHLTGKVQSDIYNQWFKSLTKFARSARKVQLLKEPDGNSNLLSQSDINKCAVLPFGGDSEINIENLVEACNTLRSSEETMADLAKLGCAVLFQRWFLDLRAKVLESVAGTLKLYSLPFSQDNINGDGQEEDSAFTSLACSLARISFQFSRIAREFDILASSFMGMDKKSMEVISENALSCSLLAFSTGFSLFFPHLHHKSVTEMSEKCLHGMLVQDLFWRLQQRDHEISKKLGLLLGICERPKNSLHSRNQMLSNSCEAIGLFKACNYAVLQIVSLQNEANGVCDDKILNQASKNSMQLLLDIITRWMLIPFRVPYRFFQARPCISSELFALDSDTKRSNGFSVLQGSQLTLDLCIQLKHLPVDLPIQLTKLYCILYCKTSFQVPYTGANNENTQLDYQDWGGDDNVYLNDRLFQYVKGSTKIASNGHNKLRAGNRGVTEIFVRFEPNEKGQGFASCLLDGSAFPLGSYRTKWLSCCVNIDGSYWSLLSLNAGPVFTVVRSLPKS